MAYLLGLDIGTSAAKALLVDSYGRVQATSSAAYPLATPRPRWSEQDPADWWRASQAVLCDVVAQAGINPKRIVGLGLTGQMHGSVFLDSQGQVIRPALLWNDQRTTAECAEITERVGAERLLDIAGNPALTGFQAPKILWLRNNEAQHFAQVAQVLLPKDYIRYRLSGVFATDASDAAGTLLLDLRARDWSTEMLERLHLPREWFPQVYEGPEVTGALLPDVAAQLDLPAHLPIVAGGGDNAAAAIGTGIIRAGVMSSSIGTSGVLFAHSDTIVFDPQGRLHTFCHAMPGAYHLIGVTLSAGGSFAWLRDVLHVTEANYDTLTAEAACVPIGAEGLLFLPYLTGERTPHLDPLARGAFVGLTARHTRAHLIRAVLEGVVYSLRDSLEIMQSLSVPIEHIRATGGGGKNTLWRQMQADIYGVDVTTLCVEEGPAYGAALLAGVGAGLFPDVATAVKTTVTIQDRTQPDKAAHVRYNEQYAVYRDLYSALRTPMHLLSGMAS